MNVNELKKKSNRRVDTGYLRNLGIQSYGDDNLYPQHLRNIIAASSTGSECAERYANFIEGNGFREVAFLNMWLTAVEIRQMTSMLSSARMLLITMGWRYMLIIICSQI